jgi:hypothetical protein
MPRPKNVLDISAEQDHGAADLSDERFDRADFAMRALELVRPHRTTVVVCEGATRLRLERGPRWGYPGDAWAMLAIPRDASKRAIALTVAELAGGRRAWALDVLLELSCESAG